MNRDRSFTSRTLAIAGLTSVMLISQGCTTLSEKFVGKEHEDIAPFAQKTVEVLAVENIQIRDNEMVYLRFYIDDTFVQLDDLQSHITRIDDYRDEIIAYSIDLVRITELYENEADRVSAYADRIEQHVGPIALNKLHIPEDTWKNVVSDIRSEETLLGALRQFQPVINMAARKFDAMISKVEKELVIATREEFDRRIQEEFEHVLEFLMTQQGIRDELLEAMNAIDKYRRGDKQAIASFRKQDAPVKKLFNSDTPNEKQLKQIEVELRERISHSTSLLSEMDKDVADYKETRAELDKKETEVFEALSVARLQIATWTQAHQALANGVKDPGEWMELSIKAAKLVSSVI